MKNLNKHALLALSITSAMSLGTAYAKIPNIGTQPLTSVIEINHPEVRVTVQDGIATLFGTADSHAESLLAEEHAADIEGVYHVINLIDWK